MASERKFEIRAARAELDDDPDLFRISDSDIRILPERAFSFRHYRRTIFT